MVEEGGVANVGAAIAFVAESEAEIDAAKAKAGGSAQAAGSNGAAPPPAEVRLHRLSGHTGAQRSGA